MQLKFLKSAWDEYLYWQTQDKKTLKKINRLIRETMRTPFEGIGKPEPLKYDMSGAWSRRISEKDRFVYAVTEETVHVISLKDHYQ